MKTLRLFGMLLLAISLCLSACGEIENPIEPTPDPKPEEVKSEITIDADITTNGLSFTSDKGEKSISFTTNEDWTLSIAATPSGDAWCSASTTSGTKGNANVKFSVTENTSYDDRSVSVTIKSGTASKTFTITQKYVGALLLTTNKYELSQDGGTIEIEVKANIDYEMEIAESAKDWITEATTRALSTYKHSLNIATNEDVEKREGEIYFKSGDKIETVKIYQEGAEAIIVLSQKEYIVGDAGETISVDIKSNIEYDVQMPDVDWITAETPTRGMSSHTLKYIISPNEGYDSRTAKIVFYDKNSELSETIVVTQQGNIPATTVTLEKAGTMRKLLGDNYLDIKSLKIVGPLNGDDIYYLRRMLGGKNVNQEDWGKLTTLDLSESSIVEGGDWYYETTFDGSVFYSYTSNNIIGESMFVGCANLQEIILPDTVTAIDHGAFQSCPTLISINIPKGLTSISGSAFYDCPRLQKVHITDLSAWCNILFDDPGTNPLCNGGNLYLNNKELTEIVIPDDITEIKKYAFLGASFHNLTLSKNLTTIGENAFSECKFLTSIEIPDNVTAIEVGAFLNCESLSKAIIGNAVSSIGMFTFSGCSNLKEIVLGKNVTTIGMSAFSECKALQYINIPENVCSITSRLFYHCSSLSSITLPENVTSIEGNAFNGCSSLTEITLGRGITSIAYQAFMDCSALVSIDIPEGVTNIMFNTFSGCSSLTTITIGNGITSIEDNAFANCSAIRDFYSYAPTPPNIKSSSFGSYDDNTTLHIPVRSHSKYESSDWAQHFKKIKEMD